MDLLNNTSNLFNGLVKTTRSLKTSTVPSPDTNSKSSSTGNSFINRDAKTLESQLNNHLRLKYKQKSRVTLQGEQGMNSEEVDHLMSSLEKKNNGKKRTWKSLELYEKWRLITEYLQGKDGNVAEYKTLLRNNALDVTYDSVTNKVLDVKLT